MQLPAPLGQNPSLPQPQVTSAFAGYGGGGGGGGLLFASPGNQTIGAGLTLFGNVSQNFNATENARQTPLARALTITALYMVTNTAQPAGQTLTVTVRKNGVNQGITFTIPGGSPAGVFFGAGSDAFAAGDLFNLQAVQQAGASASATIVSWSAAFNV